MFTPTCCKCLQAHAQETNKPLNWTQHLLQICISDLCLSRLQAILKLTPLAGWQLLERSIPGTGSVTWDPVQLSQWMMQWVGYGWVGHDNSSQNLCCIPRKESRWCKKLIWLHLAEVFFGAFWKHIRIVIVLWWMRQHYELVHFLMCHTAKYTSTPVRC